MALTITACDSSDKSNKSTSKDASSDEVTQSAATTITTKISGRFVGSGIDAISLERIADDFSYDKHEHIANHKLSANGDFCFEFMMDEESSPRYYCIVIDDESFHIPLIVTPGDDITLRSAGDIFLNYEVEGSEESQLLREFNASYIGYYRKYKEYIQRNNGRAAAEVAIEAMGKQIEFVVTHPDKLASIYAVELRLFERELPHLASMGISHIHLQSIYNALMESYPTSPYLEILSRKIELEQMIDTAPESLYPDITLKDINRNPHNLSDLKGKVTLLCFWSSEDSMSNIFVTEFKEIYNRYHDKGLEAFFVSADNDRLRWIDMVQKQQHPWISVYGSDNPKVFATYNIQVVPYAYIIDSKGDISYAPLSPKELEKRIKELL